MEITNETKLKVALQYYGCPFLVCYNIENNPVIEKFNGKNIEEGMYEPDFENKRELLILKSQSASMVFNEEYYVAFKKIQSISDELLIKDIVGIAGKDDLIYKMMIHNSLAHQYLMSKGTDLPQYLLDGKTLREAGLAIYEDEVELFANELKNKK